MSNADQGVGRVAKCKPAAGDAASSIFAPGDGGEWSFVTRRGVVDLRLHGAVASGAARGDDLRLSSRSLGRDGSIGLGSTRRRVDPTGRLTALRSVVVPATHPPPVDVGVALPDVVRGPDGFPFATVGTAAVTGAVAAVFFSPIFAMLAAVSALAVVGRWVGAIVGHRRSDRRRSAAVSEAHDAWEIAAAQWVAAESQARIEHLLTPARLAEITVSEVSPWWDRLDGGDVLRLTGGLGSALVDVDIVEGSPLASFIEPAERQRRLLSTPIDLGVDPGLAVCGDRGDVLSAARWLVGSAATRVGPADLGLLLVTTADRVADWDQLKWSPSLVACVAVDEDRDDALSTALEGVGAKEGGVDRPMLVIVDGAEPTGPGLLARVMSGRVDGVMVLWLGSANEVPPGCRSSLSVAADGKGVVHHLDDGRSHGLDWFGCSIEQWSTTMRWLGRFDDPEAAEDGHGLPPSVAMADVVAADFGDDDRFAAVLQRAWASATTQHLVAPIGSDTDGVVEVDLVADGPHMLAAGTTGAGKSELLRTLVVGLASRQPPEIVSFVLVDFKGGGAFDVVAPLPHVAAVVTDLDPAEASRALRGLRAEILDREHRLRDMEVSDVSDIDRQHPRAFGRMVVIVDEFASLAEELPDFLDGLVDIARRGRSLGVHLILATQRPSGVVTGQIRANTNLRLCLRVQDRSDSIDVVDDPMAGLLPPIPGRAVLRRGGGGCQQLQVAQVSGQRDRPVAEVFRLHESLAVDGPQDAVVRAINKALEGVVAEGSAPISLVERIVAASPTATRASAPWVTAPARASFPVRCGHEATGVGIGLLDDPDRRVIASMAWRPAADGLLVVGADEGQIAATAATAVAAALDADPSMPTFIIDGDRRGCAVFDQLRSLDPVVDVIGVVEPERLLRAVEQLERTNEPRLVVVHNWGIVADTLNDVAGPLGAEKLIKLVRRAGTPGASMVVTARTDRDVPQRALGALGCRVVHRLGDPAGYLSFGLRAADCGSMDGPGFIDPGSGLVGVIAELTSDCIARLGERIGSRAPDRWPEPVRVLGPVVDRTVLPSSESLTDGWRVPIGLDENLEPQWVVVAPHRPVVVLGHPGGGRTTALHTISAALGEMVRVLDDADVLDDGTLGDHVARANDDGAALVVGCTPGQAKRFGSVVAGLLGHATIVLLNPGRSESELVRMALPDLSQEPLGRAVLVDRGRATVVQIAA